MLLTKLVVPASAAYIFWMMRGQLLSVMIVGLAGVQESTANITKLQAKCWATALPKFLGFLFGGNFTYH